MPRHLHSANFGSVIFGSVVFGLVVLGLVCGLLAATGAVSAGVMPVAPDAPLSRAATEALVRKDLAERLKVPADELQLISASDRTWPDANLGCGGRKGLDEPAPVPGFEFTLAHGGKRHVYHSDRNGRFKRCDAGKRVAPISR